MCILKQNPKGGRPLNSGDYPVAWDKEGRMGYKIGYCENCGFTQIAPFADYADLIDDLTTQTHKTITALSHLLPHKSYWQSWKEEVILRLGGFTEIPPEEKELMNIEGKYLRK